MRLAYGSSTTAPLAIPGSRWRPIHPYPSGRLPTSPICPSPATRPSPSEAGPIESSRGAGSAMLGREDWAMKKNRKKVETYRFNGSPHLHAYSIHPVTIVDLESKIAAFEAKPADA